MEGHQKVFVVCENKCFEEGMTKEQILDLTSKASSGVVDPVTGDTYKVRVMSKTEYDELIVKENDTIYYVADDIVTADKLNTTALYAIDNSVTINKTGLYACIVNHTGVGSVSVMVSITVPMDYVTEDTGVFVRVPFAYTFDSGSTATAHEVLYYHATKKLTVTNGDTLVGCRLITEY